MAQDQLFRVETNMLPRAKLIIVCISLSFALFISFLDQNGIGLALPTIGQDLNCADTIAWAGTSSLIANTVFQVLYGRLSDIFGRKVVFICSVFALALGDLVCSFAQNGPMLYVFRGISGVGTGGITAMAMVIISDIVSLENRGKYQGILGSMVGLGNAVGPFVAAAFVEKSTWRGYFWVICPLGVLSGVIVMFILPPSKVTGNAKDVAKAIDFWGILFSTTAIMLILIPVSGGGTYFPWSSPMVITMLTIGGISSVLFLIVEWRWARMPMMPLHLFRIPALCAILTQNFLFGIVYYSHLYYLPIYYQNVRLFSPLLSASLIIPFVGGQASLSIISGQYISRTKRYGEVIWLGFTLWVIGTGLILLFDRDIAIWKIVVILFIEGMGVGNIFQPTLVAAQAHSRKEDRAVVISVRNFLRSLGGALGLAMSSAVFSNVLSTHLANASTPLPAGRVEAILASVLRVQDLTMLTDVQRNEVLDAYMAASHGVFTVWVPLMGLCLMGCVMIQDKGLVRAEEKQKLEAERSGTEAEVEPRTESETLGDVEMQVQMSTPKPKNDGVMLDRASSGSIDRREGGVEHEHEHERREKEA
jgi:EmrB/QacA subfamily drug resistance transporter